MALCPCKYLDYTLGKYGPDIELITIEGRFAIPIRYWRRGETWTDNGPGQPRNPANVQYCGAGRGRINSIFDCYEPGTMHCYEPATTENSR